MFIVLDADKRWCELSFVRAKICSNEALDPIFECPLLKADTHFSRSKFREGLAIGVMLR